MTPAGQIRLVHYGEVYEAWECHHNQPFDYKGAEALIRTGYKTPLHHWLDFFVDKISFEALEQFRSAFNSLPTESKAKPAQIRTWSYQTCSQLMDQYEQALREVIKDPAAASHLPSYLKKMSPADHPFGYTECEKALICVRDAFLRSVL